MFFGRDAGGDEVAGLSALVDGRDAAVSGPGQGARALDDLVQDGVEVEAGADTEDGGAEPGDAVSQRLVLSPQALVTIGAPAHRYREKRPTSQNRHSVSVTNHTDVTTIVYRAIRDSLGAVPARLEYFDAQRFEPLHAGGSRTPPRPPSCFSPRSWSPSAGGADDRPRAQRRRWRGVHLHISPRVLSVTTGHVPVSGGVLSIAW